MSKNTPQKQVASLFLMFFICLILLALPENAEARKRRGGSRRGCQGISFPKGKQSPEFLNTAKFDLRPAKGDSTACLPGSLKGFMAGVASKYGKVTVTSAHRNKAENGKRGGKGCSQHLFCRAIDFNVAGRACKIAREARAKGLRANAYSGTHIHVDTKAGHGQWSGPRVCGGGGGGKRRGHRHHRS